MIVGLFFCLIGRKVSATDVTGDFMVDLIIKYMLECTGATFDFDSCIVQNVAEILFSEFDDTSPETRRHRHLSRILNSKNLDIKKKFLDARNIYMEANHRLLSMSGDDESDANVTAGNNGTVMWISLSESPSVAPTSLSSSSSVSTAPSSSQSVAKSRYDDDDDDSRSPPSNNDDFAIQFHNISYYDDDFAKHFVNKSHDDDFFNHTADDDYMEETCLPSDEEIAFMLPIAQQELGFINERCEEKGEGNTALMHDTYQNIVKVLEARHCLEATCDETFMLKMVEWHFETCADVSLPFSSHHENNPSVEKQKEDSMLQCMITMSMFIPKSVFGIDESVLTEEEKCYPPNYQQMEAFCPSQLGPFALQMCSQSFNEEFGEIYDPAKNEVYLNRFCSFATDMSAPNSRECILPLCEWANAQMSRKNRRMDQ